MNSIPPFNQPTRQSEKPKLPDFKALTTGLIANVAAFFARTSVTEKSENALEIAAKPMPAQVNTSSLDSAKPLLEKILQIAKNTALYVGISLALAIPAMAEGNTKAPNTNLQTANAVTIVTPEQSAPTIQEIIDKATTEVAEVAEVAVEAIAQDIAEVESVEVENETSGTSIEKRDTVETPSEVDLAQVEAVDVTQTAPAVAPIVQNLIDKNGVSPADFSTASARNQRLLDGLKRRAALENAGGSRPSIPRSRLNLAQMKAGSPEVAAKSVSTISVAQSPVLPGAAFKNTGPVSLPVSVLTEIEALQNLRNRQTALPAQTTIKTEKSILVPNQQGKEIVEKMRQAGKSETEIQGFLRRNIGLTVPTQMVSQVAEQAGGIDSINIPPVKIQVPNLTIPLLDQLTPQKKPSSSNTALLSQLNLSAGVAKYSTIFNPTDNTTFDPKTFAQVLGKENYVTSDFAVGNGNPLLNSASFSNLPTSEQIFSTTKDSILIGTRSNQARLSFLGRSSEAKITQVSTQKIDALALQFVQHIGQPFGDLKGPFDPSKFTVFTMAGKITNPTGVEAGKVTFTSNAINQNNPSIITIPSIPNLGSGSTGSQNGGGSLFSNLDPNNTPLAVQSFPTNDISAILNGGTRLKLGSTIASTPFKEAGFSFTDLNTGKPWSFNSPITSTPGIKVLQPGGGMTSALLNLTVNPFLTPDQKDKYKLASLTIIPFGEKITTTFTTNSKTQADWYNSFVSGVTKNTEIKYNPDATGTFTSNLSNFGAGLVVSTDGRIDLTQTVNTSIPFLLAGAVGNIDSNGLNGKLEQAYKDRNQGILPIPLDTGLKPEQERAINKTINQTVANLDQASTIFQPATSFTPAQTVNQDSSAVFRFQTGLSRRAVQFRETTLSPYTTGPIKISTLNIPDFETLGFISAVIPTSQTNISTAVETYIIDPTGQKYAIKYNSKDNTVVPVNSGNAFNLIFGDIGFTQKSTRTVNIQDYTGNLNVPTLEASLAGKKSNLNFGATVGAWFNVNPNSAPGVTQNNSGLQEPGFGLMAKGFVNSVNQSVNANKDGKVNSITTFTPYLTGSFNTAANALNPNIVTAGLSFSTQTRDNGLSIVPSVAYISNNSNGYIIGLLQAQFAIQGGFKANTNLEASKNVYYTTTLTQTVAPNLDLGVFVSNSTSTNSGLSQRVTGLNYGLVGELRLDRNGFVKAKVGTGENGANLSVEVGAKF